MDYEFEIAGKLSESSIFLATSESSWIKNAQYSWKSRKKAQELSKTHSRHQQGPKTQDKGRGHHMTEP